ncbi:hypothetical protein A3D88_01965 [Candidatus Peribacteria bacterium RIFCSPHIGHO2_02_FULL_52_16]|nr:MAG: hypothetical protein A2706_05160 [Candidatus Peribacteria bacterium RIFCSPHIGHO2_01_FULL_51_35]OGJ61152.1 MAG: hypothetical protein A3D88_01965 [Candidatus Peribacteria bacterium RIFCSPHIGHO2_02_FULL_52_16]
MKRKTLITATVIIIIATAAGVYAAKAHLSFFSFWKPIQVTETITMAADAFEPKEISVFKNTNVCFKNEDDEERWPASNIHPTHGIFPEFDPKEPVAPGDMWCFQFKRTGIWRFHDHLFPELTGVITVRGS